MKGKPGGVGVFVFDRVMGETDVPKMGEIRVPCFPMVGLSLRRVLNSGRRYLKQMTIHARQLDKIKPDKVRVLARINGENFISESLPNT